MQPKRIDVTAVLMLLLLAIHTTDAFPAPTDAYLSRLYQVGDRLPKQDTGKKSVYKKIEWDDLVPKDWDPMKEFKGMNLSKLKDSDPRAQEALERMRAAWDNAPVEPSMDGKRIRLPGFIVALEESHKEIREFLLVPYFGGCIHVPPPPSNQIIHVFPPKPLKNMQTMDAVWISGVLETTPSTTNMGSASYKMKAEIVEPYKN